MKATDTPLLLVMFACSFGPHSFDPFSLKKKEPQVFKHLLILIPHFLGVVWANSTILTWIT